MTFGQSDYVVNVQDQAPDQKKAMYSMESYKFCYYECL